MGVVGDADDADELATRNLFPRAFEPTPAEDLAVPFFEISQSGRASDPAEAALLYAHACDDAVDRAEPWERLSPSRARLAQEADTWRLLHCLLIDERASSLRASPAPTPEPGEDVSPKDAVAARFTVDRELRLMQTLVDWLERCADRQSEAIPGVGSLHWENTLHAVQNAEAAFSGGGAPVITELDPDAPRRQRRAPHALDRRDDDNLCEAVFAEIRRGRFDDAVSLCVDAGQAWRAALLHGQRLLDYPEPPRDDARLPVTGNPSRALWKRACFAYLEGRAAAEENAHFRAALGALCGHLRSTLAVCSDTREDLLWAHLRAQIETRVDRALGDLDPGEDGDPRDPETTLEGVFARIEAAAAGSAETPHQEAQRWLALDAPSALLARAGTWIGSGDRDTLRFACHLALALRRAGKEPSREFGDSAVEAYARDLTASGASAEAVAHYASALPPSARVAPFADRAELAETDDERRAVADAGRRAGIDVRAVAREAVRRSVSSLRSHGTEFGARARRAVSSLGWLALSSDQSGELIAATNAVVRALVFRGDVESAAEAIARCEQLRAPSETVAALDPDSDGLREHFCLKAYLEAVDGYAAWYRRAAGGPPASPGPPPPDCSFAERVHHEQLKAKATVERERWDAASARQADRVKRLLYNVIVFPEGWLVDGGGKGGEGDGARDPDRAGQLEALRRLCVPEVVLLLLKVLQAGGVDGHAEAIALSELLASDRRKLYALFPKHKLREVLHKIGESSLRVLEHDRDPWGFEPRPV